MDAGWYRRGWLPLILLISCSGQGTPTEIRATGTLEATQVNVGVKTGGEILAFWAQEGNRVRKGDTLAVIDHATQDLQLRQAEAGLTMAVSQLQLLLDGARIEDIRQAEAALRQAEASLKSAEEDRSRAQELLRTRSATQKQKDDAVTRHTIALAQQSAARQALERLRNWTRPEELQAARARVDQAKASVDLLRKSIMDCCLVSPVGGTVTHRPFETGELVSQGSALFVISNLDRAHLMVYVTEAELGRIKLGQSAEVHTDADPKRVFNGVVTYLSPEAEFTPKNVQTREDRVKLVFGVKVEMDNPDGALKPGMPADAILKIPVQEDP